MKSFNLKKLVGISAIGLIAILGTSEIANAQGRGRGSDHKEDRKDWKQERKYDKQQEKLDKQRARIEQQRSHAEQQRILAEQRRQAQWNHQNTRVRSGNDRSNGNGYYNGNANANTNRNHDRFRVTRNGSHYDTNQRGVELLRQAVNEGYRQGFRAGRSDLDGRRRISYSNSNVYQSGTYGYQSEVNQSQYQYYFRQGFQRGYQDGANSRYRDQYNNGQYNNGQYDTGYNQQYQYGSSSNGVLSILGTILSQILNIRSY